MPANLVMSDHRVPRRMDQSTVKVQGRGLRTCSEIEQLSGVQAVQHERTGRCRQ